MMREMNPRRGFCNLFICFVVFCIIAGVGTMAKFGSRVPVVKQRIEETAKLNRKQSQSHSKEKKYEKEWKKERENEIKYEINKMEWKKIVKFTKSDYVFLGVVALVFWIILGVYWLYTTMYVVSKSWEVGANAWIFGILTLVTNLFGVACLWIYIKWHLVCPECRKIQPRNANNCALCGTAIYVKCPDCGRRISVKDLFCNGCGRKMHDEADSITNGESL